MTPSADPGGDSPLSVAFYGSIGLPFPPEILPTTPPHPPFLIASWVPGILSPLCYSQEEWSYFQPHFTHEGHLEILIHTLSQTQH